MSSLKKNDSKLLTAQAFLNIEDISDDLLYGKDGYLFGYLSVRAGDNRLLSETERVLLAQRLSSAMMSAGNEKPFQFISIPRTVDTMGMIEYMAERRKAAKQSDAKLRLINGEINSLRDLAREGAKEPMIIVKLWEKAERGADVMLKKRLKEMRSKLSEAQISVDVMNTQEITYLCKIFADLTTFQSAATEEFDEIPMLPGKKRFLSKNSSESEAVGLQNLLTPVGGLSFDVSRVVVGPAIGRIYGAMRFPSELDYGWAVDLVNNSDCVTSITYYPGNAAQMGDALARSVKQSFVDAETEGNARKRKHFEKQAVDADRLIEELDFKSSAIGHITILAMPFCSEADQLEDTCRAVCSRFTAKRIKLKPLALIQKDAYKHLSPYYVNQPAVDDMLMRLCPLETLMGGFPMTVNLYRDDRGSYFARTMDGGVMSLDLLYRGHDRTSSNAVITGMTGMGKSTALKHLMMTMYMQGVKIIVIDPEREFRDLCKNLGGTWLDVGGGAAKVNPLQIRPAPVDDEEEDALYRGDDNAMALHIHTLDVFFKLYLPSLTDLQRALLKKALIETYAEKKITWGTDVTTLKPSDFPVADDLYRHLSAAADPAMKELASLLYDMAQGADSFLWNGCTNVDLSNDFIVLDTKQLINSSDEIKRAQYFNNLTLCWQIMSEDRTKPVLLVCDEGHILFDPEIPQTSMYMRNYAKRARKYEAGLWLVTQSLVDLLNEKVKLSGQAILDCATYKIFFGTDGKNLEETSDLFNLTDAEKNILLSQQRGHALLLLGKQHIHVDFDIPQYKLDEMGTGGGR